MYILIAAAILLLALAGIAYAAVRSGYIRSVLLTGETDVRESQVIAVDATDQQDVLSLSIDEAFWEGNNLFLSYTAKVSGDGQYLLAFGMPTLDGGEMDHQYGQYVEDGTVYRIGGEEKEITGVLVALAPADGSVHEIKLNAWLLTPKRELRGLSLDEYQGLEEEFVTQYGMKRYGILSDEVLYYYDDVPGDFNLGGGVSIHLDDYRAVQEYCDARTTPIPGTVESSFSGGETDYYVPDVSMLEDLGYAQIQNQASVSFQMDGKEQSDNPVNGVAEPEFTMDGFTMRMRKFHLSHMSLTFTLDGYPNGTTERENLELLANIPFSQFELRTLDGKSIMDALPGMVFGGSNTLDPQGVTCAEYQYYGSGFLATIPDQVVLVPYRTDQKTKERIYSEEKAVTLTLVSDDLAGVLPQGMAYATDGGTYYHKVNDCMGMVGAELVEISAAEARGQKPCPICFPCPSSDAP